MEWTALSCVVLAIFLSIEAESAVSSPPEDRSLSPDPSALYDERVTKLFSDLKELLKQGDSHLKERIEEGLEHVKEQRKEGDERLKEELDEDVEWLKERQDKRQRQTEDELAEGEAVTNKEITELKEEFGKLRDSIKQWTQLNSVMTEDLKQQLSVFQAELNSTKKQLFVFQSELNGNNQKMSDFQAELNGNNQKMSDFQAELNGNNQKMSDFQAELNGNNQKMSDFQAELNGNNQKMSDFQAELNGNNQKMSDFQAELNGNNQKMSDFQAELNGNNEKMSDFQAELNGTKKLLQTNQEDGSTFIRWGRTTCPDNTDLVYSGVAGGTWYKHTGGSSNYLCLVMEPQMDNMTVPVYYSELYGTEYEHVKGHHDQNVVCSVCHAHQSTTLMIPATRTCPAGWTTQYRGHLMSEYYGRNGRTEYVCLDEIRENHPGGHGNEDGALLYHVVTKCGSLPCPPYVSDKVVTCVVCSK
ncbi:uncharacterized protein LOC143289765 isoform X2 [Babylonia areolata]|uniref:uncharacterized protein LOC143289765 isoform X2 n=1 Tax=Babylonia areolata TaxID=304850 RepID=UPI003FD6940D